VPTNYTFRQSFSPTVKDTLLETEISFSPYDAGELRTILQSRAAQASVEGVCDYSAIAKTAAIAAQDVGNARQAIDLLRVGAETAERRGDDRLTGEHIDEAHTLAKRGRLHDKISDQTHHAQPILETIATLQQSGAVPARSKEILRSYTSGLHLLASPSVSWVFSSLRCSS